MITMQEPEEISGFEKFDGGKRSFAPKVSIRKNAQIAISTGAVREYGFRDEQSNLNYKYFILYFNPEAKKIGLKPASKESGGAIKARDHTTGEIQIAAKTFLDRYGIPYDETRRFPLEYNEEKDFYVIDLRGIKERIGDE